MDNNIVKWIDKIAKSVVIGVAFPILLCLTYYSFRFTVFFGMEYQRIPNYMTDSLAKNFVYSFISFLTIYVLVRQLAKLRDQKKLQHGLLMGVLLFVLLVCLIWIRLSQTVPAADQRYIWVGAQEFMEGNYRYLGEGKYFQYYPHQLSMVLFCQIFMKLFHTTNYQAYQIFNAICIVTALYFMWKIFCVFSNKAEERLLAIFSLGGCLPLFLYAPFVYNDVVSLMFMLIAFYSFLRFQKNKHWYSGVSCAGCMTLAVMCRKNMLIAVIAMSIYLGISFLKERRWGYVLIGVSVVILSLTIHPMIVSYYQKQSGIEIGNGTTSMAYIAMGMQEGTLAEGWFNKFNEKCYEEAGFEKNRCNEIADSAIKERLSTFRNDPRYAVSFYKNKILKQWNDPTYGGLVNNSYHDQRGLTKAANSIYYGKMHDVLIGVCNLYQQMVFLFTVIFLVYAVRKHAPFEQLILLIVFLGGFFFHILWEGDSRYVLPYFVMLIPYSVWGMSSIIQRRDCVEKRNE